MQQILKLFNKSWFIFSVLLLLQETHDSGQKRQQDSAPGIMDVNKVRCQPCSTFPSCEHFMFLVAPFESISELAFSNRAMGTTIKQKKYKTTAKTLSYSPENPMAEEWCCFSRQGLPEGWRGLAKTVDKRAAKRNRIADNKVQSISQIREESTEIGECIKINQSHWELFFFPLGRKKGNCFPSCMVILRWEVKEITDQNNLYYFDATSYLKGSLSDKAYIISSKVYTCIHL